MAFWLAVVSWLLPSPAFRAAAPESATRAAQAVAAKVASTDTRRSCPQQLEACAEGLQAFAKLCRDVYQFLIQRVAQGGSKSARAAGPSQNTLTPKDLAVPWRASATRPEPAAKRSI